MNSKHMSDRVMVKKILDSVAKLEEGLQLVISVLEAISRIESRLESLEATIQESTIPVTGDFVGPGAPEYDIETLSEAFENEGKESAAKVFVWTN